MGDRDTFLAPRAVPVRPGAITLFRRISDDRNGEDGRGITTESHRGMTSRAGVAMIMPEAQNGAAKGKCSRHLATVLRRPHARLDQASACRPTSREQEPCRRRAVREVWTTSGYPGQSRPWRRLPVWLVVT